MSSNHETSTSVSAVSQSGNYVTLDTYTVQNVPRYSMLKMSVAPGSEKFFSTSREFQSRLTSPRVPNGANIPVSVVGMEPRTMTASAMTNGEKSFIGDYDYQSLGQSAYKLNPQ